MGGVYRIKKNLDLYIFYIYKAPRVKATLQFLKDRNNHNVNVFEYYK